MPHGVCSLVIGENDKQMHHRGSGGTMKPDNDGGAHLEGAKRKRL